MKIIIAPDSFKGTMSAPDVALAIKEGFKEVFFNADFFLMPIADGGEGTLNCLMHNQVGKFVKLNIKNALLEDIDGYIGFIDDGKTAIIESAIACGIEHIPEDKLNVSKASSYGVGQCIKAALDHRVDRIIIGVGGTATNDAGVGILVALGMKLLDNQNREIPYHEMDLKRIVRIDLTQFDDRLLNTKVIIASDVNNVLLGKEGATYTYGPQKGATTYDLPMLEKGIKNFSQLTIDLTSNDFTKHPGSGAGGGIAYSLLSYLNASILSGIELIIENHKLEELLPLSDILITGEGRIDQQTAFGKGPYGIAKRAKSINPKITIIGISGSLSTNLGGLYASAFDAVFGTILNPGNLADIRKDTYINIKTVSNNIARLLKSLDKTKL